MRVPVDCFGNFGILCYHVNSSNSCGKQFVLFTRVGEGEIQASPLSHVVTRKLIVLATWRTATGSWQILGKVMLDFKGWLFQQCALRLDERTWTSATVVVLSLGLKSTMAKKLIWFLFFLNDNPRILIVNIHDVPVFEGSLTCYLARLAACHFPSFNLGFIK